MRPSSVSPIKRQTTNSDTMRILILGGTNFIGPAVVARLLDDAHKVTIFHRGETEADDLIAVPHIHGDRANLAAFGASFRSAAPDVVIDMAPRPSASVEAVQVFAGIAPRIVVISSADVYRAYGRMHGSEPGPLEPMPLTEESPLREKLYPYRGERNGKLDDYDKIPIERAVLSSQKIQGTVIRLPAVYGERDYQHRLFMELTRMDAGRPAILVQEDQMQWRWSRGYVGNIADAIALVARDARAAGRTYHVADPSAPSQEEWLRDVARVAGWHGDIVAVPAARMPEHLRDKTNYAQNLIIDSSRIRTELGYAERIAYDDGLRRAIEWERANPPTKISARLLDYDAEDEVLRNLGRS